MLFSELRDKEVVSVSSGARLGTIDDMEFDEQTACIKRLLIYGRGELFGLAGRADDVVFDWQDIEKIGNDIILVKKEVETTQRVRRKNILGL